MLTIRFTLKTVLSWYFLPVTYRTSYRRAVMTRNDSVSLVAALRRLKQENHEFKLPGLTEQDLVSKFL